VKAGFSSALAAILMVYAASAAAETPGERLDQLLKRGYGDKKPLPADPSLEQILEQSGLLGANAQIKQLGTEVQQLVSSNLRTVLDQEMKAVEAQSQTPAVTAAEGGIGGGNRGLSWYCNKVKELETALPQRVQGLSDIALNYRQQLRAIPVGKDDSVAQVDSLTERFNQGITDWTNRPETKAIDQAMQDVSAGLGKSSSTFDTFNGLANAAASDARRLKEEAQKLSRLGTRLIPLIDPYLIGRNELLRELPGLQLEDSPADQTKRDKLVKDLQDNPPSPSSASAWRTIIDDAAEERSKAADNALARIQTLTASIRSEAAGCTDTKTAANQFQALVGKTQQQIKQIEEEVIDAWADRSLEVQRVDREHEELIAENEKQAKEIGERIVAAEARYDAMPQDSPERPKLYENIVKARKIGADAAQAAIDLRVSRQGIQKEQQAAQRQSTVIIGELQGSASILVRIRVN
jgi:hypothetical protein